MPERLARSNNGVLQYLTQQAVKWFLCDLALEFFCKHLRGQGLAAEKWYWYLTDQQFVITRFSDVQKTRFFSPFSVAVGPQPRVNLSHLANSTRRVS